MSSLFRQVSCALIVATAFTAADAAAVERLVRFASNATGVCQSALPAYEGLIRKRPMAVQNEGTSGAFVTCSPVTLQNVGNSGNHAIYLVNNTAAEVTISCTAVMGGQNGVPTLSVPQSTSLPANDNGALSWPVHQDNFLPFNTSCFLPPGTGIATLYTNHSLDVGE